MTNTQKGVPPPCRLFVLLAREAPVGVIFRRGPSQRVRLIHWDTATDTFTPGHWFHGRIYERRGDLSPDGRHLVYFAAKRNLGQARSSITETWTAISRPPYLTALALWPKGDTYDGGGLFADDKTLLLNHWTTNPVPHPEHKPPRSLTVRLFSEAGGGEDFPIYDARLRRDGWRRVDKGRRQPSTRGPNGEIRFHPTPEWGRWDATEQFRLIFRMLGLAADGAEPGRYRVAYAIRRRGEETDTRFRARSGPTSINATAWSSRARADSSRRNWPGRRRTNPTASRS